MNERRKKRAEELLAGRKRYVLVHGGLGWGLFFATGTALWRALDKGGYSFANINWSGFLLDWLISIPLSFVFGCLWGLCMWEFFAVMRESIEKEKQQ